MGYPVDCDHDPRDQRHRGRDRLRRGNQGAATQQISRNLQQAAAGIMAA